MPNYHLLQETPENSATFIDTGLRYECSEVEIIRLCVIRGQLGHGRFAAWPYEAMTVPTEGVTLPEPTQG